MGLLQSKMISLENLKVGYHNDIIKTIRTRTDPDKIFRKKFVWTSNVLNTSRIPDDTRFHKKDVAMVHY